MSINEVITRELALINKMFQQSQVKAKVTATQTVVVEVGYISYGLTMAMSEKFQRVEALQRELSALVTSNRQRAGLSATSVIPVSAPRLALEVAHPNPKPLLWSMRRVTAGQPHTMAIGRSYLAQPKNETVSFDSTPHILIAGITGAGKSVLLQTMLLSLCAATAPTDLRLVLVDLKNEDLVPFEKLPHVLTFAGTKAAAVDAIRFVVNEKDRRIEQRGYKPYRLVLVVDEMAQLANDGEVKEMLGDLASIGRSKAINLLGATQSVTEKGGLGALLKANFSLRLVGQVAPGMSYVATGRPQTHADLLPGKGAFLRCEGARVERFQSYFIDANDVNLMAKYIAKDVWQNRSEPLEPVLRNVSPLLVVEPHRTTVEPVLEPPRTVLEPFVEPLADKRPLTTQEASWVQELYQKGLSKSALCRRVYGSKNGTYAAWIDEALNSHSAVSDNKIITLRRAG